MDLYREAQEFPHTLTSNRPARPTNQLQEAGSGKDARHWRVHRGQIQRPFRGAYLSGPGTANLLEAARAALCVAPPQAVLGFHTAAALLGFGVAEDPANIHIVIPAGCAPPQRTGIAAHQSVIPVGEPAMVLDLPCTPAARSAIDLARTLPRVDALPVLDAASQSPSCAREDLERELKLHEGLRGIRQARQLVGLADSRAVCRQETLLRLILHDGGLRGFVPQLPVHDERGRPRYWLGLADPRTRVAAEYDGSPREPDRVIANRERHNWLKSRGWRVRYFTDDDLQFRAARIVYTLLTARNRTRRGS